MLQVNPEREYKCLVTKKQYFRLLEIYKNEFQIINQRNIYFCDAAQKILQYRASLRQRFINTDCLLTFKIRINDELIEYEKSGSDINDAEFTAMLKTYGIFPPFEIIGTLTTIRRLVEFPQAFLCMDENHYLDKIDYEIEYELKSDNDCFETFIKLLKNADIDYQPNQLSKYLRATSK